MLYIHMTKINIAYTHIFAFHALHYLCIGMQTYETATMNIGHGCMTKQAHTFLQKVTLHCVHILRVQMQSTIPRNSSWLLGRDLNYIERSRAYAFPDPPVAVESVII